MFKSPSGRKFNLKQVKLYYATNGFDKKLLNTRKHKMIPMEKKELVKEHTHLVDVLKHGSKAQLLKEASKQTKELGGYKKAKIVIDNKLKKEYGEVDMKTKKIKISRKAHKTMKGFANTLAHERLHLIHPKLSEKKISKLAASKIKRVKKCSK